MNKMTLAAGAALLLSTGPAFARGFHEIVITACDELPKVEERNIVNYRGDQTVLKANESFTLDYGYRQREHVKLIVDDEEKETSVQEFDRVKNHTRQFRGDTVLSVKNIAEAFLRSNEIFACKK